MPDAVKRYEQAIKDIDEELSKVEESIVDVIFGDGVQSAIGNSKDGVSQMEIFRLGSLR